MVVKKAAGFLIFRLNNNIYEYLLLRASYGDKHWSPPKGHVDPGEDDFTTALRETKEEAGYSNDQLNIFKNKSKTLNYRMKNGKDKIVVYWLAKLKEPTDEPKLSDEHTDYRWLPREEAKTLCGYKDFAEMVDYFDDIIVNEFL